MLIFTKILIIFMAILVISKSLHDYKKKNENIYTFLFWSGTWIFIVYVALKPDLFYDIINSLSNENIGIGTLVGVAFVFLFFITYRIYIKANRLEQKIKEIVMKIGIKDVK